MSKLYVGYHKSCPDGMAAAWSAWKFFGEGATYVPLAYGNPLPEFEEGSTLYLVDFSFKRPVLLELAKKLNYIFILDHHKSAEADLKDIYVDAPNIMVVFDMHRSGAQISWAYFHPGKPEPEVISRIADRDLWTFTHPETKRIAEAVMSHEYDLGVYDSLITEKLVYPRLLSQGEALLRNKEKNIEDLLQEAQLAIFSDGEFMYWVPVVNAPYFLGSDLANALLSKYPNAPFAATYRDTATGRRDWSLRSEDGRVDVSVVAVANGGGGHRNASGMSEDVPNVQVELPFRSYDDFVADAAEGITTQSIHDMVVEITRAS